MARPGEHQQHTFILKNYSVLAELQEGPGNLSYLMLNGLSNTSLFHLQCTIITSIAPLSQYTTPIFEHYSIVLHYYTEICKQKCS